MAQVPQPTHLVSSWESTLQTEASVLSPTDAAPATMVARVPVKQTPAPAMNSRRPTPSGLALSLAMLLPSIPMKVS
jgi:hypothetical protein